jgi:hypothetical protein
VFAQLYRPPPASFNSNVDVCIYTEDTSKEMMDWCLAFSDRCYCTGKKTQFVLWSEDKSTLIHTLPNAYTTKDKLVDYSSLSLGKDGSWAVNMLIVPNYAPSVLYDELFKFKKLIKKNKFYTIKKLGPEEVRVSKSRQIIAKLKGYMGKST